MGVSKVPSIYSPLNALEASSETTRKNLKGMDDEMLKALFHGLESATAIAWQLQADIVAEFRTRASYGSNAVQQIAKFIGVPERRAYELAEIEEQILRKAPELRQTPLEKSHYVVALSAKRYGKDPVKVLEDALDKNLGVRDLRRSIGNEPEQKVKMATRYFQLTATQTLAKHKDDIVQTRYLSPMARIVEYRDQTYLELKGDQ
jgi:hypothetical protein